MASIQTSLPPDLPDPPTDYDVAYMRQLVDLLEQALYVLSVRRPVIASTINVDRLPTSSAGLRTGDVYNDAGTLKVV